MESGSGVRGGAPPRRSRAPEGGGEKVMPSQIVPCPARSGPGAGVPPVCGAPPWATASPFAVAAGTALPRCQIETPPRLMAWRGQASPEGSGAAGAGGADIAGVAGAVDAPGAEGTADAGSADAGSAGAAGVTGPLDAPGAGGSAAGAAVGGTPSGRPLRCTSELSAASGSTPLTSVNPRAASESVKGREGWLLSGGSTSGGSTA
jgi:hypothetical protein